MVIGCGGKGMAIGGILKVSLPKISKQKDSTKGIGPSTKVIGPSTQGIVLSAQGIGKKETGP